MSQVNFIEENLNNLGELDRHDFKYLSENVEQFYLNVFNEKSFNQLRNLFKLISYEDFPRDFDLTEVQIKYINGKICFINKYNQVCYEENGLLYITPILSKVDGNTYKNIQKDILNSYKYAINRSNDSPYWKTKSYSSDYYNKCDNYTFEEYCAISIKDNQIINIIKAININNIKDLDLIMQTIALGGKLIQSYKVDFYKYIKYGFTPISVCKWEDNKAPKNWIELNNFKNNDWKNQSDDNFEYKRQDIIFYIYTGNQSYINYNDWLNTVNYSNNYEEAKAKRDHIYYKLLEGN